MNEHRREIEALFGEDDPSQRTETLSPTGRFLLRLRYYETGPQTWSYSRGTVMRVADGAEVCDIKRNYGVFHHTFVQKDGHEWLIAGRSYMSQTIVDLDTGEELEPDGDQYDGSAFCRASCVLSRDGNTLLVEGCIWACPYEYRFFDFSRPREGWRELAIESSGDLDEALLVSDDNPAVWSEDGTAECYETSEGDVVTVCTRLRRDDSKMTVVERWISDDEKLRRARVAEMFAATERWRESFVVEDPLWLVMIAAIADHNLPGEPTAHLQRVNAYFRRTTPRASADISWVPDHGPITVRLYDSEGKCLEDVTFERTLEGIRAAMKLVARQFVAAPAMR